jgi:hypothetical protein
MATPHLPSPLTPGGAALARGHYHIVPTGLWFGSLRSRLGNRCTTSRPYVEARRFGSHTFSQQAFALLATTGSTPPGSHVPNADTAGGGGRQDPFAATVDAPIFNSACIVVLVRARAVHFRTPLSFHSPPTFLNPTTCSIRMDTAPSSNSLAEITKPTPPSAEAFFRSKRNA